MSVLTGIQVGTKSKVVEMRWTKVETKKTLFDMSKDAIKTVEEKNQEAVDRYRSKLKWPGTWGHTCNSVKNGRFLYVFGGFVGDGSQTNEVYIFNTAKQTWSKPEMKGAAPCPRDSHSCTAVGNKLFVFGGCDGTYPLKDLYILDTDTNYWTLPITKGDGPAAREGHSSARIGSRLFIFGGCGRTTDGQRDAYFNDIHILSTVTLTWTKVTSVGTPPSPRDGHTCSACKNNLVVIGGEDSSISHADTYVFDVSTLVWRELKTHGDILTPRAGHTTVALGKFLVVFGGYSRDPEHTLFEDLHVLTFESGLWTKETPIATNGESPSPRFALAGDSASESDKGVIFFIGGCNKTLEALGDMYYLETELQTRKVRAQPKSQTLNGTTKVNVSMKKELKRKQQEMLLKSLFRQQTVRVNESPQAPKILKSSDPEKHKIFSLHGLKAAKGNSKLSTTQDGKGDRVFKCKLNKETETLQDLNSTPLVSSDAGLDIVKRRKHTRLKNHHPALPSPESQDPNIDASVQNPLGGSIQEPTLSNTHMPSGAHTCSPAHDIETRLSKRLSDMEFRECQPLSLLPQTTSTAGGQKMRAGSLLDDSAFSILHEPAFINLSLSINDEHQDNVAHDGAKPMKQQELKQNSEKDCSFGALSMYDSLNVLIDLNNSPKSLSANLEYSFESHQLPGVPAFSTEILRNSEHQQVPLSVATEENEHAQCVVADLEDLQTFRSLNGLPESCLELHDDNESMMSGDHELKRSPAVLRGQVETVTLGNDCLHDNLRVFQDLNEAPLGTNGYSPNDVDIVTRRKLETKPTQELLLIGVDADPNGSCDSPARNSSNLQVFQDLNNAPVPEMQGYCTRDNHLVSYCKGPGDEKHQQSTQQDPLVSPVCKEQNKFVAPGMMCVQQDSDKQGALQYKQQEQVLAQDSRLIEQLLAQRLFQSRQKVARESNTQKLLIAPGGEHPKTDLAKRDKQQEHLALSHSKQQEELVQVVAAENKQQEQLVIEVCKEQEQSLHMVATECKQQEQIMVPEGNHAETFVVPECDRQEQLVTLENKQQVQLVHTPEYTHEAQSECKQLEQLVAPECKQQKHLLTPGCTQQEQMLASMCKRKQREQLVAQGRKQGLNASDKNIRTEGIGLDVSTEIDTDENSNKPTVAPEVGAKYNSFDPTNSTSYNHVENSFEAKVTGVFHYGYNVEANIDQNLLRGLLFSSNPTHANAVQARLNSGQSIILPTVPHGCLKRMKKKRG